MGLMISNPSNRTSLINKQESSDFTYIDTEASLKKKPSLDLHAIVT